MFLVQLELTANQKIKIKQVLILQAFELIMVLWNFNLAWRLKLNKRANKSKNNYLSPSDVTKLIEMCVA